MSARSHTAPPRRYSTGEEIAHSVLHGVAGLLSVAALVVLVTMAARQGAIEVVAGVAFGASLVLLYTASTLYHALTAPRAKRVFQVLDHSAIYLLIAGTYTPFALLVLEGSLGWALFGGVWGAAALGITLRATLPCVARRISVVLYLLMGWSVAPFLGDVVQSLEHGGLVLLATGGVAYTLGVPFYALTRVPYFHAVWHVFVLAGSVLHFFAVALYVL